MNPCQSSSYAQYFYDRYNNASNPTLTFPSGCTAPSGSYASDPIGNPTAEVFSGNGASGWRCSGYNQRGQQDQSSLSVTAADKQSLTQTVNMSYNDGGELTALVYPDGETLTSQYDVNGRFQSAYFGTANSPDPVAFLASGAIYTGYGQLASLAVGGSGPKASGPTSGSTILTASFGYDGIHRVLSTSATLTSNSQTIWSQARTYDNVGNVLGLSTTVPSVSSGTKTDVEAFCYDALDRLAWAGDTGTPSGGDHCGTAPAGSTVPTYQQSFAYDDLDRMTAGPAGSVTYGDASHVHAATGQSNVANQYASYDADGNMICRNTDHTSGHTCGSSPTGASMTYDNEGRLTGWQAPSGTTASDSFLYDGEGNRVLQTTSTTTNGVTTTTDTITFDGYTETSITNGTSTTIKYYRAAGQRLAMRWNSVLYYLLADSLGSSTVALNDDGSTKASQLFAPYGAVRYSSGTMPTTYNFTGQRLDSQTGLLYYNARYYDPFSGQFSSADTVQSNAGGMNPYAYVGDNPETKTDPTGTFYSTESGITQHGGANGYVMPWGNGNIFYTVTHDDGANSWTLDGQFAHIYGSLSTNMFSRQQENAYGSYNPMTDPKNTPLAKLAHLTGWDALQRTWSNPNATLQDKAAAVGQFALTNLNNAFQLMMIVGAPEGGEGAALVDEGATVAEEEGGTAVEEVVTSCGGLSFTPTTPVATDHGEQAIGTMQVGEKVWAYNPKAQNMELEPVLHVWINHDNDLVDLTLTTTIHAPHSTVVTKTSETIHTNKKHPFLTKEKGFLPVGQITLGMHVLRADGSYGIVTGWKIVPGVKAMYNLEVAHDHTFTVGVGEWVVHINWMLGKRTDNMYGAAKFPGTYDTYQNMLLGLNEGGVDMMLQLWTP